MPTQEEVYKALQKVNDPELRLNIVDLGLVYELNVEGERVDMVMSLTAPGCPVADLIVGEARNAILSVPGVKEANVQLTFSPRWTEDRMSERLKKLLKMGMRP